MLKNINPAVLSDLDNLQDTLENDPSGARIKAIQHTLFEIAQGMDHYRRAAVDPMSRHDAGVLYQGFHAAQRIIDTLASHR